MCLSVSFNHSIFLFPLVNYLRIIEFFIHISTTYVYWNALVLLINCYNIYRCPTIHIIPYVSNMTYTSSNIIKNILKGDGFKENVFTHPVCEKLVEKFDFLYAIFYNFVYDILYQIKRYFWALWAYIWKWWYHYYLW